MAWFNHLENMTWMIGWGFFTNFVERAVIFNRRYESPLYRVIGDLYIVYYVVLSRFKVVFNIHNIIYMYLYIYIYMHFQRKDTILFPKGSNQNLETNSSGSLVSCRFMPLLFRCGMLDAIRSKEINLR